MAKKSVKKPAKGASARATKRPPPQTKAARKSKAQPRRATAKPTNITAADALVGLLESPIVADILAAGAAAALATMAQRGLSRRQAGGAKAALKSAATAAAAAMASRISEEVDGILKSSKQAKREAK
jgi:hypothetical protein